MAQECPLPAPLTLKDTQSGVVGETGTVWTIARDCSFTIARQIGPKLLDPHARGRLTPEQEARLKEMLMRIGDSSFSMPPQPPPHANPHKISISYGGRQAVLTLPPGAGASGTAAAVGGREKPLLDLVAAIKDMLGR